MKKILKSATVRIRSVMRDGEGSVRVGETGDGMSPAMEDFLLDTLLGPPADEEDGDTLELTTDAVLTLENGRFSLWYPESELSGMPGVVTRITFLEEDPSLVSVIREGILSSVFVIEQGKQHTGSYQISGIGELDVAVRTHTLKNHMNLSGGTLEMGYFVRIGGLATTSVQMRVTIVRSEDLTEEECASLREYAWMPKE